MPALLASMTLLARLSDPPVVARILRHLGLPSEPPALAPARRPEGDGCDVEAGFSDPGEPAGEIEDGGSQDPTLPDASCAPRDDDDTPPP